MNRSTYAKYAMPSCNYYPDAPCDRPKECPIHSGPLERHQKKRHLLHPEHGYRTWDKAKANPAEVTLCGLFLRIRYNIDEESRKIASDPEFRPDLKDEFKRFWEARLQFQLEHPAFYILPIPAEDATYQVYFQEGWDRREILVALDGKATCVRCERKKRDR